MNIDQFLLPNRFRTRVNNLVIGFRNARNNCQIHGGSSSILVSTGLISLICLTGIITAVGVGDMELIFPVGSPLIIVIPMVVTSLALHLVGLIFSAIFSWWTSDLTINKNITEKNTLIVVANSQETGIIQAIKRGKANNIPLLLKMVGIIAALVGILEVGVGFAVSTTTMPGLLSINGGRFYADPLVPCDGIDGGCPDFFQSRFRFQWMQGALNVLINGISKELSVNWGDVVDNERIVMVATTDNDTTITYKQVQTEEETIPAFVLTTVCNSSINFLESKNFHDLNISTPTPLVQAIRADSGLEGRWMAEVMNLEQDDLNETTQITINLVQISALDSLCEGHIDIAGNFQICRPTKGINVTCLMNTHVEYAKYITAGCDSCGTRGITNLNRVHYSSPKPVYGEYMHRALASYGGHILIPYCTDNSVGGCLTRNTNSVDQVQEKFVELLRGILGSGVMARRSLLSEVGIEQPVKILVKGATGVRLEVGKGYWITILIMCILCFIGLISWQCLKHPDFLYKRDQISSEWLLEQNWNDIEQ